MAYGINPIGFDYIKKQLNTFWDKFLIFIAVYVLYV